MTLPQLFRREAYLNSLQLSLIIFSIHLSIYLSLLSCLTHTVTCTLCHKFASSGRVRTASKKLETSVKPREKASPSGVVIQLCQVSIKTRCRKSDARIGAGGEERIVSSFI